MKRPTKKMSVAKKKLFVLSVKDRLTDLKLQFCKIVTPIQTWEDIKRRVFNSRLLKKHIQRLSKMTKMTKTKKG